jgi:hypothetical protein
MNKIRDNNFEIAISESESNLIPNKTFQKNDNSNNELRCNICLTIPLIIDINKQSIIYKCDCGDKNNEKKKELIYFIKNYNTQLNKSKCNQCINNCKEYCFNCHVGFCDKHKDKHIKHNLFQLNQIDYYCEKHPKEKKICYCTICMVAVCVLCKSQEHNHYEIDSKSIKSKDEVITYFTDGYPTKDDINNFRKKIENLQQKLMNFENNHLQKFSTITFLDNLYHENKIINENLFQILLLLYNSLNNASFPTYSNYHNFRLIFDKMNLNFGDRSVFSLNQEDYQNYLENNFILNVNDYEKNSMAESFESKSSNSSLKRNSLDYLSYLEDMSEEISKLQIDIVDNTNEIERINLTNKEYPFSIYNYEVVKELKNSKKNLILYCLALSNKNFALLCGTHVELINNQINQIAKSYSFNSFLISIEELINEKKLVVGSVKGNLIVIEDINKLNIIKEIQTLNGGVLKICRFNDINNKFACLTKNEIKIFDSTNYNCLFTLNSQPNESMHSIIEHSSYLIAACKNSPIKFYYYNNNKFTTVNHKLICNTYSNNSLIRINDNNIAIGSFYKIFIVFVKKQLLINTIDLCIEKCFVTALLQLSNKGLLVACSKIEKKNNINTKKYIIKQYDDKKNEICQLEQVHKGAVICLTEIDEKTFMSCSVEESISKIWKKPN